MVELLFPVRNPRFIFSENGGGVAIADSHVTSSYRAHNTIITGISCITGSRPGLQQVFLPQANMYISYFVIKTLLP